MGTFRDSRSESRPILVCLEGNGYRPSHRGDGYYVGGVMYTLNSTEVHGIAYREFGLPPGGLTDENYRVECNSKSDNTDGNWR